MASHVLPLLSLLLATSPSFHSLHPAFLNLTNPSFHPQTALHNSRIYSRPNNSDPRPADRTLSARLSRSRYSWTADSYASLGDGWFKWRFVIFIFSFYPYCHFVSFSTLPSPFLTPLPLNTHAPKEEQPLIQILRT